LLNEKTQDKSVFSTGDNIHVSVNFKENLEKKNIKSRLSDGRESPHNSVTSKVSKSDIKPSVIIDILDEEGPYRVIETPKDLVDISMSDGEREGNDLGPSTSTKIAPKSSPEHIKSITPVKSLLIVPTKGPMTPPEPDQYDPFDPTVSPDNEPESLPAHTPPLQPSTPPPGPQTPPPASPSLPASPPSSPSRQYKPITPPLINSPGIDLIPSPKQPKPNMKRIQQFTTIPGMTSVQWKPEFTSGSPMDMDLDNDSPSSPGSGSDLSDLFEPPSSSPPTSSLPKISLPVSSRHGSRQKKKASDSKAWQNIIGEGGKSAKKRPPPKQAINVPGPNPKMTVNMKVIDDKLKIIDEVPSSAVEMAVKDKFLKKVQRQERIVEEVKLVLKPAYNNRQISKEAYKEILRKTVPKVCHSRYGEINPSKIAKLVQGYIKKHEHSKKKTNPGYSF